MMSRKPMLSFTSSLRRTLTQTHKHTQMYTISMSAFRLPPSVWGGASSPASRRSDASGRSDRARARGAKKKKKNLVRLVFEDLGASRHKLLYTVPLLPSLRLLLLSAAATWDAVLFACLRRLTAPLGTDSASPSLRLRSRTGAGTPGSPRRVVSAARPAVSARPVREESSRSAVAVLRVA